MSEENNAADINSGRYGSSGFLVIVVYEFPGTQH